MLGIGFLESEMPSTLFYIFTLMEKAKPTQAFNTSKGQVISLEKGKIPPQALDLEVVVLGALMIDKKGVDEVIDILAPDVFYKEQHKHCLLYTSPSPRDRQKSRMPSSA